MIDKTTFVVSGKQGKLVAASVARQCEAACDKLVSCGKLLES